MGEKHIKKLHETLVIAETDFHSSHIIIKNQQQINVELESSERNKENIHKNLDAQVRIKNKPYFLKKKQTFINELSRSLKHYIPLSFSIYIYNTFLFTDFQTTENIELD